MWQFAFRCLLLVVSAWPGPMPVVHTHLSYQCDCGVSLSLSRHLALFHSDEGTPLGDSSRPHLHWVFRDLAIDRSLQVDSAPCHAESLHSAICAALKSASDDSALPIGALLEIDSSPTKAERRLCRDATCAMRSGLSMRQHLCRWTC